MYKVEKQGQRIKFSVDELLRDGSSRELVYEDERPLTGNRIAIWTYDHAIMLSRASISSEDSSRMEHPDFQPGPLKMPRDWKESLAE